MQRDALGLRAEESVAYRALITVPSAGADEFGALLRVSAAHAGLLLSGLEQAGLAVRSLGDPDRFVAAPPATTLRDSLRRRREELQRAEAEVGVLDEVYRAAALRRGAPGVVDVIQGAAAVREVFGRLQLGAREEVLTLVKAPISVITAAENVEEDSAVARGVRYRVVFERAMLDEEPDAFERIVAARAAGEEIRIADSLPVKLLIVDREHALMPLAELLPVPGGAGGAGPASMRGLDGDDGPGSVRAFGGGDGPGSVGGDGGGGEGPGFAPAPAAPGPAARRSEGDHWSSPRGGDGLAREAAGAGALLVRERGLLLALVALFEAEWRTASAVAGTPALDELDGRIVSLLMTGLTDEAVATHLGTSLRTVQRRVRHLMDVTGGRTRMQLGFHVARLGWLD